MATNTFQKISDLQAELAKLQAQARTELVERKKALLAELESIEEQLATMGGEVVAKPGKKRGRKPGRPAKRAGRPPKAQKGAHKNFADADELKTLLSKAEGKKLNRKGFNDAGYSLKSAIAIAKEDKTFGHKQNRAQGEVWLK